MSIEQLTHYILASFGAIIALLIAIIAFFGKRHVEFVEKLGETKADKAVVDEHFETVQKAVDTHLREDREVHGLIFGEIKGVRSELKTVNDNLGETNVKLATIVGKLSQEER